MRTDDKDRYCPECGADLLGKKIPSKDLPLFNAVSRFKEYNGLEFPENYEKFAEDTIAGKLDDDPRINTHFDRRIGIYSLEYDKTIAFRCPDCNYERKR